MCFLKNVIFAIIMYTDTIEIDAHCYASVDDCRWVDLPVFTEPNGKLAVCDNAQSGVSFHAERIFFSL